jgi:hypothetical protein
MEGVRDFRPSRMDYRKIASALDYYEARGYEYMEMPWVVSSETVATTLPQGREATRVQYGDLVGSGEQSFIEVLRQGETVLKACCVTPCFRMEESYDDLHFPSFMKMELIDTNATDENLQQMIADAGEFHGKYVEIDVIETEPNTYDIVDTKLRIELGSYGIRTIDDIQFVYGTGVALPRLDTVIEKTMVS